LPLEKGFYNQSIMIGLCHKPLRFTNDRIAYCSINGNIKGNGRVSLKHLVDNSRLTFAKPVSREYPHAVQTIFESAKDNPRFETISGADSAVRVLNLLEYGSIDFTLEYPAILKYLTITEAGSRLRYYYTTELGDTPITGAVSCTNNSFSQHLSCCD
jgi:hypothetical protein